MYVFSTYLCLSTEFLVVYQYILHYHCKDTICDKITRTGLIHIWSHYFWKLKDASNSIYHYYFFIIYYYSILIYVYKEMCQYLAFWLNGIYSVDWSQFLNHYPWYTDQNKLGLKIKQFAEWDSLSFITPCCSHIDDCAFLITIDNMNNPLGSMHGWTSKRGTSPWPLNIAGSSVDPFSVVFRQYKYILVNVRLISCSLSTYNTINIVTTSIILSLIYNCEWKRDYNDENVILFKILAYTVV